MTAQSTNGVAWQGSIGLPFFIVLSMAVGPAVMSAIAVLAASQPFSFLVPQLQTPSNAHQVLLISIAATVGICVGWLVLARPGGGVAGQSRFARLIVPAAGRYYAYAATAVLSGTFAMHSLPGTIWTSAYERGMQPLLGIGMFPVFALFGVLGLVAFHVSGVRVHRYQAAVVAAVAAYVIVVCLLFRGARLDASGFFLAGLLLLWIRSGSSWRKALIVLAAVIAILAMHTWGVYRAVAARCDTSFAQVTVGALTEPWNLGCKHFQEVGREPLEATQVTVSSKLAVVMSTPGNIAISLYQLLDALHAGTTEFQLGKSYLDYLPRTLPSILYPNRPRDFSIPNVNLGQGSLYFLTEAYANFGLAGVALVSAVVGWLFGTAANQATMRPSFATTLIFLLVFALLIRSTWYQFFGLYKSLLTWTFLELGIALLLRIWPSRVRPLQR